MVEDLNLDNIGDWPALYKFIVVILVAAALGFGGYTLLIKPEQQTLRQAERKERSLRSEYEVKHKKVVNLPAYREQMKAMEEYFQSLLSLLPKRTEVPDLIDNISRIALENGLEIMVFDPQPERSLEFYVEFPIKISVQGSYHEIGNFVSEIAKLPRIVTFHDFDMSEAARVRSRSRSRTRRPQDDFIEGEKLTMNVFAKTYRYRG